MNFAVSANTDLEQAKTQMREAAQNAMRGPVPRDLDRAWKSVAMQLSEAFVTENYAELQRSFDSGLVPQ